MYSRPQNIDALINQGYAVDMGKYLSRGWELFQKNIGGFIGFALVLAALVIVVGVLPERLDFLGTLASVVLTGPLAAGWYYVTFRLMKQQVPTFNDFFLGFNNFLPLFLANLLVNIFVGIGMVFLLLPGIFLAVAYIFTVPLIVERRFDFWAAMETSRKLITKQWFAIFVFVLVLVLINILGALLLGVGLLVTIPLTSCAVAAAYEDIVGLSTGGLAGEMPVSDRI
ncbi:MAG: hypothetical protein KME20_24210 [Kaiparowitsia implicata GSE-PSE-MK54-09C]|jgi:uncharacterized membrane protein|nr:hypothetical protein [Kaiparowitsia implicata GSE-PSE-MK54-09C]